MENQPNFKQFLRILSNKDRIVVGAFSILIIGSLIATIIAIYFQFTKPEPLPGGEYSEGIIGQPLYVNPILAITNDADADLCQLIFSGLFKYDANGRIVPDLAESYELSEDKLNYTVHLKKGVAWHDGESFNANDVLYTVQVIQDPEFRSPFRQSWQGVGVEVIDDYTVKFNLKNPYAFFLNNLTIGILPSHIWESVAPSNFFLAEFNMKPIGTGPYKFLDFEKDADGNILSYKLAANDNYHQGVPFIKKVTLNFYFDEDSMLDAFNRKQIMGMSYLSPSKLSAMKSARSSNIYKLNIPRYFAVFFNQQRSKILADRDVRKALALATDRGEIINKVLLENGKEVISPLPPGMVGATDDVKKFDYNVEKANQTLEEAGWKRREDNFREKDNQTLEFNLVTTDWPDLQATAEILKSQWEKIGVKANIESYDVGDVQQNYIRPREYDALLFGQVLLGMDADPYAFWHSSQSRNPGLNLALYSNPEADKILEKIKEAMDISEREKLQVKFQQVLTDDIPCIFLYSPTYLFVTNKKVRGIELVSIVTPDKRFTGIERWYVNTKRVRK